MNPHAQDVKRGQRFEFGKNWTRFLSALNEERIIEAEKSLKRMLEVDNLNGKSFLDIGSGSGLFSLAARRLGARVYSFDYDPQSVACTSELRSRFFKNDPYWTVKDGSVLDRKQLNALGQFDIVYSWGVLHHTGAMWQALENVVSLVAEEGQLFIAIYNDQGMISHSWKRIKRFYNILPGSLRFLISFPSGLYFLGVPAIIDLLKLKPFSSWREYVKKRGMVPWRDVIDWVGGYPFEVAKPEEIFDYYHKSGFELQKLTTCGGYNGCNEFVFIRKRNNG